MKPADENKYREDEALVKLALSGDDSAMAQLIAVAMPIAGAKAAAQQAKNNRLSAEDLIQEGMLGFLSALKTYSAEKNTSFRTYAGACIGNRIISAVRLHNNTGNYSLTSAVSISDEPQTATGETDPQNIMIERERFEDFRNLIEGSLLSDFEKNVLGCRLSGLSYSETAKRLGTTSKAVDNALSRIRKKIRETV
ncbi:MAG: sigma-70 family RNA polymerase sigma factor [Clostridia bacterium]|nr:sigma-70 family RNA polymerase sigma factor [Clostridia bacterium]